jgi:uncharacterized membrane protein YuzA (DUF378 family)/sporulation protein YlmC with PRC-barrel domain
MVKLEMFIMFLVILGSLNWGTNLLGFNLVEKIHNVLNSLINKNYPFNTVLYMIIVLAALYVLFRRDTWLPFLGKSAFPEQLIPLVDNKLENTIDIPIKTVPNKKIAYWAALKMQENQDVKTAYNNYENSGVVLSDNNGNAVLKIKEGDGYNVPYKHVKKHIHYRVLNIDNNNLMGPIETLFY